MNPEKFKDFLYTIVQYPYILLMFIEHILKGIWSWFDGKKTVIGGVFFIISDYIMLPAVTHYGMSPDWEFWLKTVAGVFVVLGIAHKGAKKQKAPKLK